MSRSYRRTPIFGIAPFVSEKQDKRWANRRLRLHVRLALHHDLGAETLPLLREVSNVWGFRKDGKRYCHNVDPTWMRK